MSQCRVPNWNLREKRQVDEEERNRSSHHDHHVHMSNQQNHHVHMSNQQNTSLVLPMSNNFEVAELTWENGQLAMHGLGGLLPTNPTKPTWVGRGYETLESIVHQATCTPKQDLNLVQQHDHSSSGIAFASSCGKSSAGEVQKTPAGFARKRLKPSDSNQWGRSSSTTMQEDRAAVERSACASATAAFGRENENTMMTWASIESARSLKTKTTDEDYSANCHGGSENRDEELETKGETGRSHSTRRIRAAAVHNQSERRRRDRINQKMKALQKLVPNASKTDKASMLDEVIEYLKQLQAQVNMMNSVRNNMPQMMMPLGMQQQIQMSLLARMGMGLGLGMGGMGQSLSPLVHPNAATSTFVHQPPFMVPPMVPNHGPPRSSPDAATGTPGPFNDPYYAFIAQQSMNMDLYSKMAAIYRQQVNHTAHATNSPS